MSGWSPLLAADGVTAFGDWTLIATPSGGRQWAYKGEPLFTHADDPPYEDMSEQADDARIAATFDDIVASVKTSIRPKDQAVAANARTTEGESPRSRGAASAPTVDLKQWKLAIYEPEEIVTPPGISVAQISNAFGEGLVDRRNMTIYFYRGKATKGKTADACDGPCAALWAPVQAPARAIRVGEFTVVPAEDGTSQWAFRGMPLYTSAKDIVPGHANGTDVGPKWQAALTTQYFMPRGITVAITPVAEVLTVNGQALYTRNPFIYQLGGHNVRDGLPGSYAVGKKQGIKGCDSECLKEWRPLIAAPDAKAGGFWQIAERPDGTRQWEYKGYVLYTYTQDKGPGEINGNDIYDLVDGEAPKRYSAVEAGGATGAALFWHVATP
jgi:predicted lipoprotein with Yx(FWY)xxD motif